MDERRGKDILQLREYAKSHIDGFVSKLESCDGEIYNAEFKRLREDLNRAFSSLYGKGTSAFLLRWKDDLFPGFADCAGNDRLFEDLYYSSPSLSTANSFAKKARRIIPQTDFEKSVRELMVFIGDELGRANALAKSINPKPGRRKLEDWERKPEPDRFTCPCCFRRQAKDPNDRNRMADHGFVKAGYRKGICPGAQFAPLEVSNDGNLYFLRSEKNFLNSLSLQTPDKLLAGNRAGMDDFLHLMLDVSRNIRRREFITEAIDRFGNYGKAVEKDVFRLFRRKAYDAYRYAMLLEHGGGFLGKLSEECPPDVGMNDFFRCESGCLPELEWVMEGERKRLDDELTAWLVENIDFDEFANALKVHSIIRPENEPLEFIRDSFSLFGKMPDMERRDDENPEEDSGLKM